MCHIELHDRVAELSFKDFTLSHVRNDPPIFAGCAMKRPKANLTRTKGTIVPDNRPPLEFTEQKGDLLICNL